MNKFTYNMFHEIQRPTVILSSVHHKHYGVLENIDYDSFSNNFNMNSAQEISFDVYKYLDEHKCSLWEKLISFKYLYIPDHNEYYKIDVTLDQDDKTVKHITATSAGEYELSQRKIQAMDINTPDDATYYEQKMPDGSYKPIPTPKVEYSMFYNPDDPHKSILDRAIANRAPDWSIGHVDSSIIAKKRICTFTVSNQTIYDFLVNSVANEFDVLFKFDSVNRIINAYDLLNMCENPDCLERGEFTDVCPKCGGTHIHRGYGNDSHIYISANNYASKITVDGDEGSVKNCFRIMGGDDLMTATVKNCNPSGSEYIYQFSETDFDDMPKELVDKLEDYAELYAKFEAGDSKEDVEIRMNRQTINVDCGFKPDILSIRSSDNIYSWEYKYGDESGDINGHVEITDTGFKITAMVGDTYVYSAYKKPYGDLTKDYYNALTEYYYYKTSMMPRTCPETVDPTGKVDHWQPNTNYNLGQICYVITLPSYCYLKCITQGGGTSGSVEFDATNVIPSDGSSEPVTIQDGTITWEVVRNDFTMPTAQQTLDGIIRPYVADANNVVYFEDSFPAGLSANPQTFTTVNKYVKDLLATVINPLFKIEILNSENNVSTWSNGWELGDTNPKHGRLNFYIRITNTTDTKDTAEVVYNQTRLTIRCAIADSVKQHQEYMQELVKKRLDKKDENFTSIYETEKRDNSGYQLTGGATSQRIELGYVPQYVAIEYITTVDGKDVRMTLVLDYGQFFVSDAYGNEIMLYDDPNVDSSHHGFWFTSGFADVLFYYTAVSDELFETTIKQYSLDLLTGFLNSYSDCRDVLISNKVTDNEDARDFHGVDLYATMYAPYNHKVKLLEDEVARRESKVKYYYNDPDQGEDGNDIPVGGNLPYDPEEPIGLIQRIVAEMTAVHDALNLKEFLKDETVEPPTDPYWMWNTLFNYVREGEYQNSNYISDGLANNILVQYAQELLDKGTKELKKATELQYSLSDDLGNLLNTEEFAPFKDKFELGDYIICGIGDNKENLDVDDHNYKLRLISLSYDYGNPESVSVTFANVTKIKNYFSDTQDILAQAKSMGSSYNAVTHQVDKNTDTTATVNSWNQNGLDSSLTKIMNNTREEVTYDNSGIILKEYDYNYDESKDNKIYSDDQLRITHDILAFTEDNWKTASLGLGRQNYTYYDNLGYRHTDGSGYGLIAKFVDAGFIRGSQFIAGDLYSDKTYVDNGVIKPISHMNYNDGTFELAEGKLKFYYELGVPKLYINAGTELHGDLIVKDNNDYILFEASTDDHNVQIGGFAVDSGKIYGGDSTSHVVVMQKPSPNMYWVFAAGGTSHSNYSDCPFKVSKNGELYSTKTIVDESNGLTSELSPGKLSLYGSLSQDVRYSFNFDSSAGQILTIGKENYSSGTYQNNTPFFVIKNDGKIYTDDIYVGSANPASGEQKSVLNYMTRHNYVSGTQVFTNITANIKQLIFTDADVASKLGVASVSHQNTAVYLSNGDANAQSANIIACYHKTENNVGGWYAQFDVAPSAGNYRFNYIITYFG